VRVSRAIVGFYEWLPLLATPFAIYFLTDGFSHSLSLDVWLIIGLAVVVNIGWIAFHHSTRGMADFYKKYPGFRMKKHG